MSVAVIVLFAVLTFIPTPYLYATRGGPFARVINMGAAIWFVMLGLVLLGPSARARTLAMVSLIYPLMYLSLSAVIAIRARNRSTGASQAVRSRP